MALLSAAGGVQMGGTDIVMAALQLQRGAEWRFARDDFRRLLAEATSPRLPVLTACVAATGSLAKELDLRFTVATLPGVDMIDRRYELVAPSPLETFSDAPMLAALWGLPICDNEKSGRARR